MSVNLLDQMSERTHWMGFTVCEWADFAPLHLTMMMRPVFREDATVMGPFFSTEFAPQVLTAAQARQLLEYEREGEHVRTYYADRFRDEVFSR